LGGHFETHATRLPVMVELASIAVSFLEMLLK